MKRKYRDPLRIARARDPYNDTVINVNEMKSWVFGETEMAEEIIGGCVGEKRYS